MEKLNQSIRSKCKKNAREQIRGRDATEKFHVGTSEVDVGIEQAPIKKLTVNN